jgi:hypothetical protein
MRPAGRLAPGRVFSLALSGPAVVGWAVTDTHDPTRSTVMIIQVILSLFPRAAPRQADRG